jgi:HEPN domain-containing protein
MKTQANKLFFDAVERLNEASEELFRPEEDVVTYAICKNAQFAIENFLKGFLLKNEIDPSDYKTIEELYEQCKSINKKFEEIDLTEFGCKSHTIDSRFCNEVSKVSNCYDIADSLDTFFRREKIIN